MRAYRAGLYCPNRSPVPTTFGLSEDGDRDSLSPWLDRPEVRSEPASIGAGVEVIAVIEPRTLARETLAAAFATVACRYRCRTFSDLDEWRIDPERGAIAALLVCLDGFAEREGNVEEEIRQVMNEEPAIPIVAIGESEEPGYIARLLGNGARGYIPTSVGLDVAVQAVSLAIAGGVFVPAVTLRKSVDGSSPPIAGIGWQFGLTERQAAVAGAVAQGKPTKVIAYELGLCESTVKVHIRTIMKKLQARNRTEIAFKLHAAKSGSDFPR
jgi:DNA-binding NarL/FixJ family response regulator